jgi:hypothetical protein
LEYTAGTVDRPGVPRLYRGWVAIHAGREADHLHRAAEDGRFSRLFDARGVTYGAGGGELPRGMILGVGQVIECSPFVPPPWWIEQVESEPNRYELVIAGILKLTTPLPCRGSNIPL